MAKPWTHGKVKSYDRHGCRCDECKRAKAVDKARRADKGDDPGNMPVACWCEERMIPMRKEDVWAGVGVSCGKKTCVDPRGERKVA